MKKAKRTTKPKAITESDCKPLAAMLPNPLSAAEMLDIFFNLQRLNAFDQEVDKTDHELLRKLWADIGSKVSAVAASSIGRRKNELSAGTSAAEISP